MKGKNVTLHNLSLLDLRKLRPRAFICFSVFGTRDEAFALVFDILRETLVNTGETDDEILPVFAQFL